MGSLLNPDDIPRKRCDSCECLKFLSGFAPDEDTRDGCRSTCMKCERELSREAFCSDVQSTIDAMDSVALQSLQQLAMTGAASREMMSIPHASSLLEDVMTVWGGSMGFAQHMMGEYLAATPGSYIRQSYLKAIIALTKFVSEQDYVKLPLEHMNDDDLEKLHADRQRELRQKLGVFDGEVKAS